jgi:hypothetical protein
MSTTPVPTLEKPPANPFLRLIDSPDAMLRLTLFLLAAAYFRTVFFDFAYDDHSLIELNPWVTSWKYVPVVFGKSFWQFTDWKRLIDYYRPLVTVLFIAVRQICGSAPAWFHLVVVGVHLVTVYLTFGVVRRLTGNAMLAVLSAAIFGLNPSKVESVAWISGVSDSLCMAFFLGAAILFIKWEETGAKRWIAFSAGLMFLGILSKEVLILGPGALAVYAFSKHGGSLRERARHAIAAMVPYAFVIVAALAARMHALRNFTGPVGTYRAPIAQSILSAPEAVLWYLRQQIWPNPVSVHYPLLAVKHFSWLHFVLPLIAVLAILGTIAYFVRRSPAGQFLFAWGLLTLAPVIAYHVNIQLHDRYAYLPSLATSVGAAYLLLKLFANKPALKAVCIPALLGCMAALTSYQASFWEDDVALFEHAVKIAHNHPGAYGGLAAAYGMRNLTDKELEVTQQWVKNVPEPSDGWYTMSSLYLYKSEPVKARDALEQASDRLRPGKRYFGLGNIALQENDCVAAEDFYHKAIEDMPRVADMHSKLGAALRCQGREKEGWEEFAKAEGIRKADSD